MSDLTCMTRATCLRAARPFSRLGAPNTTNFPFLCTVTVILNKIKEVTGKKKDKQIYFSFLILCKRFQIRLLWLNTELRRRDKMKVFVPT